MFCNYQLLIKYTFRAKFNVARHKLHSASSKPLC